jgi:hypothetical protein
MLHISKTRNSSYHPQSSGLVERLNRTLEDRISKNNSKNQKDWDFYLPFLMMAYRSSVHDTMGEAPCFMMIGREVTLPIDLVFGVQEPKSLPDYVEDFINRMDKVHEVIRDRLMNSAERQNRHLTFHAHCPVLKLEMGCCYKIKDNIRDVLQNFR